jgi:hypothetical protein
VELLPDDDEREHLLDRLAQLILAAGADTFVAAPIVGPDDRAFPDRWALPGLPPPDRRPRRAPRGPTPRLISARGGRAST